MNFTNKPHCKSSGTFQNGIAAVREKVCFKIYTACTFPSLHSVYYITTLWPLSLGKGREEQDRKTMHVVMADSCVQQGLILPNYIFKNAPLVGGSYSSFWTEIAPCRTPNSHSTTERPWRRSSRLCERWLRVSTSDARSLCCLLLWVAAESCEELWAPSTALEVLDSDLAGNGVVLGEGVTQWRLIEASPISAEVIVVIVIQHFTR